MTTLAIIIAYLVIVLAIGLLSHRFFKGTSEDFFVAARTLGPFILLVSLFGANMTAFAVLGSAGEAYMEGIGVFALMASSSGLVIPTVFYFVGTRVWALGKRRGYLTPVQFFRERWGSDGLGLLLFVVLIASGALDVWRTVSSQVNYKVFDKDAVELAEQIKVRTPKDARFLNAPTYNSAVVLTGRQSIMRYPGHLSSHGIDYRAREADVKQIYQGGPNAEALLEKYEIDYVLISPEERNLGGLNEQYFNRFPVAAETGQYKVYKIR